MIDVMGSVRCPTSDPAIPSRTRHEWCGSARSSWTRVPVSCATRRPIASGSPSVTPPRARATSRPWPGPATDSSLPWKWCARRRRITSRRRSVGHRGSVGARPCSRAFAVVAVLLAMATAWNGLRTVSAPGYQFRQVTFRRGQISGARFAPDGHSILYAASWDMGAAAALHDQRRQPGVAPARLRRSLPGLRSRAGELALLSIDGTMPITGGVLFRVPMNGRAAACRTERHVGRLDAERRLAIVRATSGVTQIELPAGRSIYRTSGWISSLRVSPRAIAPASSSIRSGTRSRDG